MTDSTNKQRVEALIEAHHGQNLDPDDISEALGISWVEAATICEELVAEGRIARAHRQSRAMAQNGGTA